MDLGDVWMPNHGENVVERMPELRRRADEAGRTVPVFVMGAPPDPAVLERYAEAGVERALFWLPSARHAGVERALDEIEDVMSALLGT